jgi:hypothetical protein
MATITLAYTRRRTPQSPNQQPQDSPDFSLTLTISPSPLAFLHILDFDIASFILYYLTVVLPLCSLYGYYLTSGYVAALKYFASYLPRAIFGRRM